MVESKKCKISDPNCREQNFFMPMAYYTQSCGCFENALQGQNKMDQRFSRYKKTIFQYW